MLAAMTSTWMSAWGIGCRGGAGGTLASSLHVLSLLHALLPPSVQSSCGCFCCGVSASDHMCHDRLGSCVA
eukprot:13200350-Alexandrium_andersonii.AAC.1